MNWFSNKGQVVQTVIAAASLAIAIANAKSSVDVHQALSIALIVFTAVWVVVTIVQAASGRRLSAMPRSGRESAVRSFTLELGARTTIPMAGPYFSEDYSVELVEIVEEGDAQSASVRIQIGGGVLACGADVRKVGVNHFLLPSPRFADPDVSRIAAYRVSVNDSRVGLLAFYLTHINPHAKTAEIKVIRI